MDKDPTLIILHGGQGTGEAERLMAEAKVEVARKNTLCALSAGFSRVFTDGKLVQGNGRGLLGDGLAGAVSPVGVLGQV